MSKVQVYYNQKLEDEAMAIVLQKEPPTVYFKEIKEKLYGPCTCATDSGVFCPSCVDREKTHKKWKKL